MRIPGRTFTALALATVALATGASSAQARSSAQYRIEGGGWGHGIGMSQYGADAYAGAGLTADQIISHYFTGTVLAPRPADGPSSLRVLLQSYLAPARVQMTSAGTLTQGTARLDLAPGDVVEMRAVSGAMVATRIRAGERTVAAASSPADAIIVPAVDGGATALFASDHATAGTAFRGTLTGHVFDGAVSVVNTLPFESYLRGVVPHEMPASWHPEALKAQAIAARGYAVTGIATDFSWFDVYSDTRSQVYGGIGAEDPRSDAAVAATAGLVARVGSPTGAVARTFFFSTSPGRTASNEDVWGSTPYPYLRSVDSPGEASPYTQWSGSDIQHYTPAELAAKLASTFPGSFSGNIKDLQVDLRPSGYVGAVRMSGTAKAGSVSGTTFQSRFGLRSTYFRLSLLSVSAPTSAKRGTLVKISGRAPSAGVTNLLVRVGAAKTRLVPVKPAANGTWFVRLRVSDTTTATLTRGGLAGPAIRLDAV